nr:uncharacterized protein LOC117604518 isoform X1 [Osmia lignaria]
MVKLKKNLDWSRMKDEKEYEMNNRKKSFSKVEALYLTLMCFSTYCLSSIALETGGRSSVGNTMTKSAAFNALFRRTYNLKIIIHVKNVISGLISTVMMVLGDKYGIPYLYLPWLVNTMKGMALYEGPTLVSLANVLLPNVTVPTGTFIFTTFFLYAEELFIWSDVFAKFQHCWKDYHYQKQIAMEKIKEKLFIARNKKILYQGNRNYKRNTIVEKIKIEQKPVEICNKINNSNSLDFRLRSIKSSIGDNNLFPSQFLDVTG